MASAGLFDPGRIHAFVEGYRRETDGTALVQQDAIINHLLCLHILHQQYVAGEEPAAADDAGMAEEAAVLVS